MSGSSCVLKIEVNGQRRIGEAGRQRCQLPGSHHGPERADVQRGVEAPVPGNNYTTTIVSDTSIDFLEDAMKDKSKPFFLMAATVACHASSDNADFEEGDDGETMPHGGKNAEGPVPIPEDEYKNDFMDLKVPDRGSYGKHGGVSWVSMLKPFTADEENFNQLWFRRRLQALQSVDKMVKRIVDKLDAEGVLDNTYIIYTTDNGFHIGQHRLRPGKTCPFEEDINIPLIIRGPKVPKGATTDVVSSHTDIVPTILKWAGQENNAAKNLDGKALVTTKEMQDDAEEQNYEHTNVEYWGTPYFQGKKKNEDWGIPMHPTNTYKATRVIGKGYNLMYSVYCSGEHELYDMTADPAQTNNLVTNNNSPQASRTPSADEPAQSPSKNGKRQVSGATKIKIGDIEASFESIRDRLDALTAVLMKCKGDTCTKPWKVLHPSGDVHTFKDAMLAKFDSFYHQQEKVKFDSCTDGYFAESESPEEVKPFGGGAGTQRMGKM